MMVYNDDNYDDDYYDDYDNMIQYDEYDDDYCHFYDYVMIIMSNVATCYLLYTCVFNEFNQSPPLLNV